ncbi:MAG: hemerythrin domain-containing protein [Pirellulaceae bacterium]|nr:hemerythrin domain-containing protein [Planctomycetales bacterium]MCA9165056.1 hemerythrin domain-containing protein [Planctomycetales bacterium]MCA9205527.1 hemerythrin domain-containing protein [Planctomycetales bacterium]MCA9208718.1 hemerythrin domain-containing protein [Planctomycetales bacterium]
MASVQTATVTVNAAFMQEIKEVNQELWELLRQVREICGQPFEIVSRREALLNSLELLRDQLALHFALEEAYGYFDDPVIVAPRLSQMAEQLRGEHRDLYMMACGLAEFVEQRTKRGELTQFVEHVAAQFDSFYNQLLAHEAREQDLILAAYDDDIGVGD